RRSAPELASPGAVSDPPSAACEGHSERVRGGPEPAYCSIDPLRRLSRTSGVSSEFLARGRESRHMTKPTDLHRLADEELMHLVHDRRRASAEVLEERQEAPDRTDVEVARRDEARTVREAMKSLPEEQHQVIRLAYFGGFTHTQIAEMLDMPVGTVKGRMRLG